MHKLANNRRALIIAAVVVAFVTIVVPTCRMIGCSMDMSRGMAFMHPGPGIGFFGTCGGELVSSEAPDSIAPVGLETLLLGLAALIIGMAFVAPRESAALMPVRFVDPPPPPLEPRGERFRV